MKTILLILVGQRKQAAVQVQKVLTGWGCMSQNKIRHSRWCYGKLQRSGIIDLELAGERKKMDELARKVSLIKGVSSKLVDLKVLREQLSR
ncbi:MAG: hypothetical protein MZV64_06080 [Ignavibacteriales bacterium]|nr:hypothetical protein [Ignavibacteriales bacterium]